MTRKIKILHFEIRDNVGGIESFLLNLYSAIDRDRYQFDFITTSDHPALEEQLETLGGHIYKVSSYKHIFSYIRDIRNVLAGSYDIAHIHKNSAANVIPFMVASEFPSLKVIAHSHSTMPNGGKVFSLLHRINKKYLWNNSDVHLACSTVAGEWMYGQGRKFEVIPNGIDVKKYLFNQNEYYEVRKELNISEDTLSICHIGSFAEPKNHCRVISIFSTVKQILPKSKLILLGAGQLEEDIRQLVKKEKLEDSVLFLGIRKDIYHLLKGMDVFLMPSLYEGLGIAAVEAQAAGLNVWLSTAVPKEVELSDHVNWFSLSDSDEDIAKRIVKKGKPDINNRLKSNHQVIQSGYDYNVLAQKISLVYEKLVKNDSEV